MNIKFWKWLLAILIAIDLTLVAILVVNFMYSLLPC